MDYEHAGRGMSTLTGVEALCVLGPHDSEELDCSFRCRLFGDGAFLVVCHGVAVRVAFLRDGLSEALALAGAKLRSPWAHMAWMVPAVALHVMRRPLAILPAGNT